jgi:hypothetical protein
MVTNRLNSLVLRMALLGSLAACAGSPIQGTGTARLTHTPANALPPGVPLGAQRDPTDPNTVLVRLQAVEGGFKAGLTAASPLAQRIVAPDDHAISGTEVIFPPGVVVIDTEVSLVEAPTLATADVSKKIAGSPTVANAGVAVAITSSVPFDPPQAFTVTLAVPSGGAALTDPEDRVAVLYDVTSATTGERLVGMIPRDQLVITGKRLDVAARYFGTYQAVVLAPLPPVTHRLVFRQGVSWLAAGRKPVASGGLRGWLAPMRPTTVAKSGVRLELDVIHIMQASGD